MIKKCKITNLVNGIIYGVTKEPIRSGKVVELNSGQILTCLMEASVDEVLSDGTLVRLNKSNYNTNNEHKKIHIDDQVHIDEIQIFNEEPKNEEPVVEPKNEDSKGEEPVIEEKVEEPVVEEPKQNNNYQKNNKKKNR